ncbi:MAG: hypothetical protein JWR20_454 [Marmoricola sp.]|nr:hypothetical protein [Marmoricola sp.]
MLNNLSGIGAVQDALATTNELLAAVLAELQQTNAVRLEAVAVELRALKQAVDEAGTPV